MEVEKTLKNLFPRIYIDLGCEGDEADIELSHEDSPVEKKLIGDLIVFYAFDMETHFEILSLGEFDAFDLDNEGLHQLALNNLRNLNLDIQVHQSEHLNMLTAGGDYEAALILLSEIWDSVSSMVDGDLLVSVPTRDIIYFTGSSPENTESIKAYTSKMVEEGDKPLSNMIFRRKEDFWGVAFYGKG
ncbi:MAG: DUF1444 family protein [Lentisphaeraceae bacterium]|nr:DUF1444 family protein [Lentisphaeraceae bacterium]